jgi:hypothetical protein
MRPSILPALLCSLAAATCAPPLPPPAPAPVVPVPVEPGAKAAIASVLDSFHDAAAHADEDRYLRHLTEDAVFLGTDATERWDKAGFRVYSHPHFANGKAWSFKSIRREITIDPGGVIAWFDEDLETPNLGPARGSGVLVKRGSVWKISQYNLAITVPSERFKAVKRAAAGEAEAPLSP